MRVLVLSGTRCPLRVVKSRVPLDHPFPLTHVVSKILFDKNEAFIMELQRETKSYSRVEYIIATRSTLRVLQPDALVSQSDVRVSQLDALVSQPDVRVSQPDALVSQPDVRVSQLDALVSQSEPLVSQPDVLVSQQESIIIGLAAGF